MNYSKDLIDFLNVSPVNYHAVKEVARRLDNAGYKYSQLRKSWAK